MKTKLTEEHLKIRAWAEENNKINTPGEKSLYHDTSTPGELIDLWEFLEINGEIKK